MGTTNEKLNMEFLYVSLPRYHAAKRNTVYKYLDVWIGLRVTSFRHVWLINLFISFTALKHVTPRVSLADNDTLNARRTHAK